MGLFRRSRREPEPAPAGPAGKVQRAESGDVTPAWRSAAPLTPTVTAPASTFKIGAAVKEDLVALDSPRLSHGMGHLAGGDGLTGVVGGLATVTVQRRDASDAASPPGDAATDTPLPDGRGTADLPVVSRSATGDGDLGDGAGNGNSNGASDAGTGDDGWHARLVPRIVAAGSEAWAGGPGRPVDAHQVDASPRHLPLVTSPMTLQRQVDTEPTDDGGDLAATPPPGAGGAGEDELGGRAGRPSADLHRGLDDGAAGGELAGADRDLPLATSGDAPTPRMIQRSIGGPAGERPRPGALGPPLQAGTGTGTGAAGTPPGSSTPVVPITPLQRRGDDAPAPAAGHPDGAGSGGDVSALDLAIHQRPRPGTRPTGDLPATPTVARHLAGEHPEAPPTGSRGPDPGGTGLPLVQRALDDPPADGDHGHDEDATSIATDPATTHPTAEPLDAGRASRDDLATSTSTDATVQRTAEHAGVDPAAVDGPAPGGSSGAPQGLDLPTVRPTLGLDGNGPDTGPGPGAADATGTSTTAPADTAPLPLAALQRRTDGNPTSRHPRGISMGRAASATTSAGAGDADLAAVASVPPPPGPVPAATSPQPTVPVTILPLVAQRSLAVGPSLRDALATRAPNGSDAGDEAGVGTVVAPLATWPAPAGGGPHGRPASEASAAPPSVQRWPDLGSVTGADALPALDLARPPQPPEAPSVPDIPDAAGLRSLGGADLPAVPSVPAAATAAASAVPMTEITFPSPSGGDGTGAGATGGAAASPAGAATAGAAGGPGGGAPAGGDLDELAHKLYDRIRWRMRSELRLDRERAGLGAGVRH